MSSRPRKSQCRPRSPFRNAVVLRPPRTRTAPCASSRTPLPAMASCRSTTSTSDRATESLPHLAQRPDRAVRRRQLPSRTGIKNYLQGLGITTVDYHFCSHYHSDHLGCIDDPRRSASRSARPATTAVTRIQASGTYTAYVNTLGAKRQTMTKNQIVTLDAGAANPCSIKCVDLNGAGVLGERQRREREEPVMLVSYGNFQEEIGGDLTGDVTWATTSSPRSGPGRPGRGL